MSAFYFGDQRQHLFGYYHAPRGQGTGAALLCPSWGPEYQYSHRALRLAARRLAERGLHVLRFDYSGTGDSWGDTTDGDMERWLLDIGVACRELQGLSGIRRIDLVGLRIGAALACSTAAARSDVRRLVLWDPVVDGERWVSGFRAPAPLVAHGGAEGEAVEFAQQVISAQLLAQFRAIDARRYPPVNADAVLVLQTQEEEAPAALSGVAAADSLTHEYVADVPSWLEDTSIWSGQVPARALKTLAEWLTQ